MLFGVGQFKDIVKICPRPC